MNLLAQMVSIAVKCDYDCDEAAPEFREECPHDLSASIPFIKDERAYIHNWRAGETREIDRSFRFAS
jgi:hypothetical protein